MTWVRLNKQGPTEILSLIKWGQNLEVLSIDPTNGLRGDIVLNLLPSKELISTRTLVVALLAL